MIETREADWRDKTIMKGLRRDDCLLFWVLRSLISVHKHTWVFQLVWTVLAKEYQVDASPKSLDVSGICGNSCSGSRDLMRFWYILIGWEWLRSIGFPWFPGMHHYHAIAPQPVCRSCLLHELLKASLAPAVPQVSLSPAPGETEVFDGICRRN